MGLGVLKDCISCLVTEERNGVYELEGVYPINGYHFQKIEPGRLIKAKPNDISDPQMFRIYSITKLFNHRVQINAEHISYALNNYPLPQGYDSNGTKTPGVIFSEAMAASYDFIHYGSGQPNPYTFSFDIGNDTFTAKSLKITDPTTVRSILGGTTGHMLDLWRGEYEFDNLVVRFRNHRGVQTPKVTIKYGKNLTDLEKEISNERIATHVIPYVKKTIYTTVESGTTYDTTSEERYAYSNPKVIVVTKNNQPIWQTLGYAQIKMLDLSDKFADGETLPAESEVKTAADSYISDNITDLTTPKMELDVEFQPLGKTYGNIAIEKLESIGLCDKVRIVHESLGIDENLTVNTIVYDSLLERCKKIEIGDARSNFSQTVRNEIFGDY